MGIMDRRVYGAMRDTPWSPNEIVDQGGAFITREIERIYTAVCIHPMSVTGGVLSSVFVTKRQASILYGLLYQFYSGIIAKSRYRNE